MALVASLTIYDMGLKWFVFFKINKKIDFRQTKVPYGSLSGRKSRARQKISHLGQDSSGHLLLFHVAELDASRVLHLS